MRRIQPKEKNKKRATELIRKREKKEFPLIKGQVTKENLVKRLK